MIKKALEEIIKFLCTHILKVMATMTEAINTWLYKMLFKVEWGIGKSPLYFNHNIEVYYSWKKRGDLEWMLRGIFSKTCIDYFENPMVMELGCGDGFNTKNIYYAKNEKIHIIAIDNCQDTIKIAKKKYKSPNINYIQEDFLMNMPEGDFTNIIWDGSMNFFGQEEIGTILKNIVLRLNKRQGILTGMTVISERDSAIWEHYKIHITERDLLHMLKKYFTYVRLLPYRSPSAEKRVYFYATNSQHSIFTEE